MPFAAPSTRGRILERFAAHLAPDGRAVIGFGTDRGYSVTQLLDHASAAGLSADLVVGTWDLRPRSETSDFVVAVLSTKGP